MYAFVDPNDPGFVTFVTNFIPLEFPSSGPNFHRFDDNVLYEVMVDNDGDAVEDITFQFRFRRAHSRFPGAVCRQRWTVRLGEVEPVFGQTGRVVLDITAGLPMMVR